ncbi:MAG: DUF456 domain-containing protein [Bacteroidetes bacterium HGW-Bacteroidetes-2]|jgi:hypothetical protein|nr:MAG: DUF456 domain-containing protein [Bacteroidetes bacterium HGW-Bacteroidetes-2]
MDVFLVILGFVFMLVGILGSVLPVLPGVPISWLGLLMIYLVPSVPFDWFFLTITFVLAIFLYLMDYIIPAIGTKHFGGSKSGAWCAIIGLFVGIIAPIPFGILIGPFLGAFIGEMAFNKTRSDIALKAAFGSFIGFIASTFMKILASFVYLGLFIYKVWIFKVLLF